MIKLGLDASKESLVCERDEVLATPTALLIDNILELPINDDRKLIEAAIRLYNDLRSSFTDLQSRFPDI